MCPPAFSSITAEEALDISHGSRANERSFSYSHGDDSLMANRPAVECWKVVGEMRADVSSVMVLLGSAETLWAAKPSDFSMPRLRFHRCLCWTNYRLGEASLSS